VLWEADSGRKLRTFEGHTDAVLAVAFRPGGKLVLTGSEDMTAVLWESSSGRIVRTIKGHASAVLAVACSPDGKHLLTGSLDSTAALWEAGSGRKIRSFQGHTKAVRAVAFSPDGKRVLTGSEDGTAILWEAESGRKVRAFDGDGMVHAVCFSPDGKHLLTGSEHAMAILWEAGSGQQVRSFKGHVGPVLTVAFSPDGKHILTSSGENSVGPGDSSAGLWEVESGRKVRTFEGHTNYVLAACFSPDGKQVLTGSGDRTAVLWDTGTGSKLRTFKGHSGVVRAVCFSPDGKYLLTGSNDQTAALWDADSGRKVHAFEGHTSVVWAVAFSPDGKRVLTGTGLASIATDDGSRFNDDVRQVRSSTGEEGARLWDVATGDELARLFTLDAGQDWLVLSPEGLFDGSLGGREKLAFRIGGGLQVVALDRFFQDFSRPGLLALLLQGQRPLPEVGQRLQRAPQVRIVRPQGGTVTDPLVTLEAEATDQGDGVRGPWLLHNGARVLAPGESSRDGNTVRRRFVVPLVQGENQLAVQAASADGSAESPPATISLRYERSLARPDLYVLAIGVNRYKQEAMNLKFAAADARAIADLFDRRGKGSLYANVHPITLLNEKATRAGIRKELEAIARQARAQDTLVVFIAGHGCTLGQRYYFIPHEFSRSEGRTLEDDVRKQGVPGDELADHLGAVPALKRVLVLDTCQSGGALALNRTGRDPFALRGAVERLSRAQGVFTIAAASAGEEAKEAQELGHGVLSYALLAGLKGVEGGPLDGQSIKPTNPERVADVLEWFSFASGQVPRLTRATSPWGTWVPAFPTSSCWSASPSTATRRPSRPWSGATVRSSSPPAGGCWRTGTRPRTLSRPPLSSWPGRPACSGSRNGWARGSTGWPSARPARPAPGGLGAARSSDGPPWA
jgi:WD40 repeat protein